MKSRYVYLVGISVLSLHTKGLKNPIKTIKKNGFIALLLVTVLYILANVAYFAAGECMIVWQCTKC